MSTLVSFVGEVETAIASGDANRRSASLRKITDLFVQQAPALQEGHVAVFDEVILRLARDIEFKARVELSDRLADVDNAPRRVVKDLALDDNIAVARPILERSKRLTEADLVEVAERQGQDHLLALSRRATLTERVTDILVDRGNASVVRSVAGNNGARFSEDGFHQLAERARGDEVLQRALRSRSDLGPDQMARLVEVARAKARETLTAEMGETAAAAVDLAVDGVAQKLAMEHGGRAIAADAGEAMARVARIATKSGLGEDKIAAWVRDGDLEEALAGLAYLSQLPFETVSRAYTATSLDPLLVLVRSLRFGWGTFKLLLVAKAGRTPSQDLMRSAFDNFQQLSIATAQRVVRFTLAREKVAAGDAA